MAITGGRRVFEIGEKAAAEGQNNYKTIFFFFFYRRLSYNNENNL